MRGAVRLAYGEGLDEQLDYAVRELNPRDLKATLLASRDRVILELRDTLGAADHGPAC